MAFNGVFNNGFWTCGLDFLASSFNPAANGVFDQSNGVTIGSAYARFGVGKGFGVSGQDQYLGRSYGVNLASSYIGFACAVQSLPSGGGHVLGICTGYDSTAGAAQFTLGVNTAGQLGFYSGGGMPGGGSYTQIGGTSLSATGIVIPGNYLFIEIFNTISATVGVFTLNINGVQVLTATGLNNRTTANAYVNRVYWGASDSTGAGGTAYFDDLYLLDNTGSAPFNTFLGPMRIQTDVPNADSATGGLNAWTPTTPTGVDYSNCANIPPNSAEYNQTTAANARMSFRYPAIVANQVLGLNMWYSVAEDSAGARTVNPIFRSNAVDQDGPNSPTLTSTFTYYNLPSATDPNTSASWASGTVAAAGSCELGLEAGNP